MLPRKVKKYPRTVADVAKQAEKIESYFADHRADFQREYPSVFTDEFFAKVSGLVRRIRTLPSDTAMRGHQASQTAGLEIFFERFDVLFTKLVASVQKAYPNSASIQREFGIGRKADIDHTIQNLLVFLDDLNGIWEIHGNALTAVGCPAGLMGEFETLQRDCITQSNRQGAAMDQRHITTEERTDTANELWDDLETFESHANAIYGKTSAVATKFHLDRSRRSSKSSDSERPTSAGSVSTSPEK